MTRDLHSVAGWEVPSEALFVCTGHATLEQMDAEFGADNVVPVTWAQVELTTFYCPHGDHQLEPEPGPDDVEGDGL